MQNHLLLQARQNRLIGMVRVSQACFSLASTVAEPAGAGAFDASAHQILTGYLGFSTLGLLAAFFWRGRHENLFLGLLAVDGLVFAALLYMTAGATISVFALFLLILLSTTLQWGWRGAAISTATALAVFAATGLQAYRDLTGLSLDPSRVILRMGEWLSVGGLLVAYGHQQERINGGMLRLFGTPLRAEASDRPPTFECLEFATAVFGAEEAAFIWDDPEEPGLQVHRLEPGGRRAYAWPSPTADPLVDHVGDPFFFDARDATVISLGPDGQMRRDKGDLSGSRLLRMFDAHLTLVLPVSASGFSGWILLPEFPDQDREALMLGGVVATQSSVALEAWRSLVAWRDTAAAEERVRIARDLHDGTLQFMAGTAMQLTALARELEPGQMGARDRVQRLLEDLKSEQRQLRLLIDSTTGPARLVGHLTDFEAEVRNLAAILSRRWSTEILVRAEPARTLQLQGTLAFELLQIVREAISNAVRHGRASVIRIDATADSNAMKLTIADNGVGMPVHGVFNLAELKTMRVGPRMLRDRVAGLGGELTLETGADGTRLSITAPLSRALS